MRSTAVPTAHAGAAPLAPTHRDIVLADYGLLLLRILLGGLLLMHGFYKATHGVAPVMGLLQEHGLPGGMAYLAYAGEIVAPALVIAGLWTRPAAAVVAVNMLFAIGLAHLGDIGRLNDTGGWAIELQAFYLGSALVLLLTGPGRLSVSAERESLQGS